MSVPDLHVTIVANGSTQLVIWRSTRYLFTGEKRECEFCGVKFSRHDNLQDHIKLFHTEHCHEYGCDRCMKSFTKKSNLVRHRKVSHTCVSCLAVFCTSNQLQVHMKTDHPKYTCDHCQRSFQDRANMKRHTGSTHNENGTWKNYCKICNIGFCSFLDLARHNKRHPKGCKFCGKIFKTNWSLKSGVKELVEKWKVLRIAWNGRKIYRNFFNYPPPITKKILLVSMRAERRV